MNRFRVGLIVAAPYHQDLKAVSKSSIAELTAEDIRKNGPKPLPSMDVTIIPIIKNDRERIVRFYPYLYTSLFTSCNSCICGRKGVMYY